MVADAAARRPAVLILFDVLELDGEDCGISPAQTSQDFARRHSWSAWR